MSEVAVNQDLLKKAVATLPSGALAAVRGDAATRFATLGFPTVGDEDWKYTNLATAAAISNEWLEELAQGPSTEVETGALSDEQLEIFEKIDAYWLLTRNGVVDAASLQQLANSIGSDVTVSRLGDAKVQDISADDSMSAFNAALLTDGLLITANPGAKPDKPIGILCIDESANRVTQARILIDAGKNARLRIIQCAASADDGQQFTNSVTEATLASGASLGFVQLQMRSGAHLAVNRFAAQLERDASLDHNAFDFGGALTRNDVVADIVGTGASVNLHGLYLASGEQHIDNHTTVRHGVGPATSEEEYRGILNGRARCVFNGKAIVAPGADGTDAAQSNHNLLLSDKAEIDTKPELEIYADDVKCSHGATVGQLDETSLYYLRTRGLGKDEARRVLTRAFAAGTLTSLAIDECHDYLADALDARLADLVDEENA